LRDIGSFDSFRSKFFTKVISFHVVNHLSLNEYDLRILSSDFLIEMFDLWGKELKYGKELLLNHYGKSVQDSARFAGPVGRVKTVVTNHLRKMF